MFNVDQIFSRPDFSVTVSGGSIEENAQMATAVMHSMRLCGFGNVQIDPGLAVVPDHYSSAEVLNSLRLLNPDLFDTSFQIQGQAEQAAPSWQPFGTSPQMPFGQPSF